MRCSSCRFSELGRELTKDQVLAAVFDETESGNIPKDCRTTVAEKDFPAVWQTEKLAET